MFLFILSCATREKINDIETFRAFWNPALDRSKDDNPNNLNRIRVEGSALLIEGLLINGDCDRVKTKLEKAKVDKLIVNSQGGLVHEGLCIADLLKTKEIRQTIVKGVCWSSCANYLFLGADEKTIERGTVGFHGNSTALMKDEGVLETVIKASTGNPLDKQNYMSFRSYLSKPKSPAPLNTEEKAILKKMVQTYEIEKKFFSSRGISQNFFDMTQLTDKGENDGEKYLFLLPSSEYFNRELHIKVNGDQDIDFVEKANLKFPVKLLIKN